MTTSAPEAPLHVLWVEDDAANRYLIRAALKQLPATAKVQFVDGPAAVPGAAVRPDLVVLDLDMLGPEAAATVRRVQAASGTTHASVAVFGRPDDGFASQNMIAGVTLVLKPIDFASFVAAVGQVLAVAGQPIGDRRRAC